MEIIFQLLDPIANNVHQLSFTTVTDSDKLKLLIVVMMIAHFEATSKLSTIHNFDNIRFLLYEVYNLLDVK
ncbi:hypothetical protein T10_790 [Trichinella papuae]|uniref:Uncharacterized protein n=1 Tax=Trichinella papuae TaxID=268474 RepID=A0A0V1MRJ4_9BILA|nr:hypothetical protein T10_790 [Trichinella papuae]